MRRFSAFRALQVVSAMSAAGALAFAGCAAETTDSEPVAEDGAGLPGVEDESNDPVPPPAQQCVTIKRGGPGNVTDAFLAGDYANYANGTELNMYSGISTDGNVNKVVVGFDLTPVPASATLVSATFSIYKSWSADNAIIDVHRAKSAWNEATVTREAFGNGSDELAVGSFSGSGVGQKTVDITSLVQGWREGAYPNHGIVIEEMPIAAHHYFSSEAGAAFAPSLTVCYVPASCDDGLKNQGEAGVDCGGPCAACPSCNDGVQNQGEGGVDCGGPCAPCATCSDGVKNGSETGIDCGGSCAACPTCVDGVKNGSETGVDCGGSCSPCSISQVGSFAVNQGPAYNGNPLSYSCIGACAQLFGGSANQYACSTTSNTLNNQAWVSGWGDGSHCFGGTPVADNYSKPVGGNYNCGSVGCSYSAYVSDHCGANSVNYCWKTSGALASCKAIKQANPGAASGTYTIDPDGAGAVGAQQVYCDMTTDGGGYTMMRINDAALAGNQDSYAAKCAAVGMEVVVPRTKAHMQSIYSWNGDWPNLVNVFPNSNGATGLNNWHGVCKGASCGFYLSGSTNAWCNGFEPNGDNNVSYRIYRISAACGIDNGSGGWNDANNAVAITGSVICSTNDK